MSIAPATPAAASRLDAILETNERSSLNARVPKELYLSFAARCKREGRSIQDVVTELLEAHMTR